MRNANEFYTVVFLISKQNLNQPQTPSQSLRVCTFWGFVQEKMFEQNPLSKLLKDLLIGIEQLLEVFCLDSIGKTFVFAQKKREIRIPHLLNFEQCISNFLKKFSYPVVEIVTLINLLSYFFN